MNLEKERNLRLPFFVPFVSNIASNSPYFSAKLFAIFMPVYCLKYLSVSIHFIAATNLAAPTVVFPACSRSPPLFKIPTSLLPEAAAICLPLGSLVLNKIAASSFAPVSLIPFFPTFSFTKSTRGCFILSNADFFAPSF